GHRIALQDQPAKVLCLLVTHPGELVTREDIQRTVWEDGHFVEVDHGINAAIKKIRVALEDDPNQPTLLETLPKKGYRFIGNVQDVHEPKSADGLASSGVSPEVATSPEPGRESTILDQPDSIHHEKLDRPFTLSISPSVARFLFLLIQSGYIALYCAALYYIED